MEADKDAGLLFSDRNGCPPRWHSLVIANQPPVLDGGISPWIVHARFFPWSEGIVVTSTCRDFSAKRAGITCFAQLRERAGGASAGTSSKSTAVKGRNVMEAVV